MNLILFLAEMKNKSKSKLVQIDFWIFVTPKKDWGQEKLVKMKKIKVAPNRLKWL